MVRIDEFKISVVGLNKIGLSFASFLSCKDNVYCLESEDDESQDLLSLMRQNDEIEVNTLLAIHDSEYHDCYYEADYNESISKSDFVVLTVNRDNLETEVKRINKINSLVPIVIVSNVLPGTIERLRSKYTNEFILFVNTLKENQFIKGLCTTNKFIYSEMTDKCSLFDYLMRTELFDYDDRVITYHLDSYKAECVNHQYYNLPKTTELDCEMTEYCKEHNLNENF